MKSGIHSQSSGQGDVASEGRRGHFPEGRAWVTTWRLERVMCGSCALVAFAGESLGLEGNVWGMKSQGREAGAENRRKVGIHSR